MGNCHSIFGLGGNKGGEKKGRSRAPAPESPSRCKKKNSAMTLWEGLVRKGKVARFFLPSRHKKSFKRRTFEEKGEKKGKWACHYRKAWGLAQRLAGRHEKRVRTAGNSFVGALGSFKKKKTKKKKPSSSSQENPSHT